MTKWRELGYPVAPLQAEVRQRQPRQRGQVGNDRPRQVQAKRPVDADVQALVPDAHRIKSALEAPLVSFAFAITLITVTLEELQDGRGHLASTDLPCAVSRYFCKRLFGFSGIVMAINPRRIAGVR